MKRWSEKLRARWAPHGELPTLFFYLEPQVNGGWLPERIGVGEVLIWEKDIAVRIVSFQKITEESGALVMEGDADGLWSARLEFRLQDPETGRVQLRRRFTRTGPPVEMAIEQSAVIDNGGWWPGNHLVLPSFDYNGNPFGRNRIPHPEPIPGFSVRTDRLAQPMVFYQDLSFSYGLSARKEHPSFPSRNDPPAGQVYSIGVRPSASPLRLSIRYPHEEYAQEGNGPGEVYDRKNEFSHVPDVNFTRLDDGETFEDELYLWIFPLRNGLHDYAVMSRFLWSLNFPEQAPPQADSLLNQFRLRMDYVNNRHYSPGLGYYDTYANQRSCAELMAVLSFYQGHLDSDGERVRRGMASLDEWTANGAQDGALLHVGRKEDGYSGDLLFTRCLGEAGVRILQAYEWSVCVGEPRENWLQAALQQADWLIAHALPDGSFARQYDANGDILDNSNCQTAYGIHLLAEAFHHSQEMRYLEAAKRAFDAYEENILAKEAFFGATLDAFTEDKEAAIAGLEAALALYRVTGEEKHLNAARIAADHVLTYTWAYRMDTFEKETPAGKRGISTFGATAVSTEYHHLDPYISTSLIELGVLLDDPLYMQMGIQSLWWALDGRWAILVPGAGAKQPERLFQTNWHYPAEEVWNRGDCNDQSETGWTSALPAYQFLKVGGTLIYANLKRGVGIDGCLVESVDGDSALTVTLQESLGKDHDVLLVVKNLPNSRYKVNGAPVESIVLGTGYRVPLAAGEKKTIMIEKA